MNQAHKDALAAGRERARKRRAKESVKRVNEYRAWLKESADHMGRERALERAGFDVAEIDRQIGPVPRMSDAAAMVTDSDYQIAREIND